MGFHDGLADAQPETRSSSSTGQPGRQLTPTAVKHFPAAGLFEEKVLWTFFLELDQPDWEQELADFKHPDVELPAKLTVAG